VPDPVAERIRVGFLHVRVVMVAEEAGPGGEVGGDVRGGRSNPLSRSGRSLEDMPASTQAVPQQLRLADQPSAP
jgi:hypothetical protein